MIPSHRQGASGAVAQTAAIAADIQPWLEAVLESTSDAIIGVSLGKEILSVNSAACRMFGYAPTEFLEHSVDDITIPERAQIVTLVVHRLANGEPVHPIRTTLRRSNGDRFPAAVNFSPIRLGGRSGIDGFSCVIRDLSSEKESEETRRLLMALVQSSRDAIYSRTFEGTVTFWNPAAETMFGFSSEEIVGRPIHLLVPPEKKDEIDEVTERIRQGEIVSGYHTIRVTKDGQRIPVALTAFPLRDESGAPKGIGSSIRSLLVSPELRQSYDKLERLSPRERQLLGALADGLSNNEIAAHLGISEQTVKNYVSRILLKLGVASRAQAAAEFMAFRSFLPKP